jgi:hypothetical protein
MSFMMLSMLLLQHSNVAYATWSDHDEWAAILPEQRANGTASGLPTNRE